MSIPELSGQFCLQSLQSIYFVSIIVSNMVNSGSGKQTDTNKSSDIIQFPAVHLEQVYRLEDRQRLKSSAMLLNLFLQETRGMS
jgi:hypothetical protein